MWFPMFVSALRLLSQQVEPKSTNKTMMKRPCSPHMGRQTESTICWRSETAHSHTDRDDVAMSKTPSGCILWASRSSREGCRS
ncbi:hypothetical protein B0T21DRAFT_110833 [Apiosordaria backusii]|uniref:Secreted protein n=1 Tax=Apiosordaria backusii TaxID=314023 RepID=A0AA39ZS25_9PEZI|nr:hypothetical protein B0T21DRAFT_110833 [Apiosordaria backusii]